MNPMLDYWADKGEHCCGEEPRNKEIKKDTEAMMEIFL